jgi:hypothetical protein
MIVAFISNLLLFRQSVIYAIIFVLQLLFYLIGVITIRRKRPVTNVFLKIPEYFVTVNFSILVAWFKLLKGERLVRWQPTVRN